MSIYKGHRNSETRINVKREQLFFSQIIYKFTVVCKTQAHAQYVLSAGYFTLLITQANYLLLSIQY